MLLIFLLSFAHAEIPFTEFTGLVDCIQEESREEFSFPKAFAFLKGGGIYKMRLGDLGNYKNGEKADKTREYTKDSPQDQVAKVVKILFPSPTGILATQTTGTENFGKLLSPEIMGKIIHYWFLIQKETEKFQSKKNLLETDKDIMSTRLQASILDKKIRKVKKDLNNLNNLQKNKAESEKKLKAIEERLVQERKVLGDMPFHPDPLKHQQQELKSLQSFERFEKLYREIKHTHPNAEKLLRALENLAIHPDHLYPKHLVSQILLSFVWMHFNTREELVTVIDQFSFKKNALKPAHPMDEKHIKKLINTKNLSDEEMVQALYGVEYFASILPYKDGEALNPHTLVPYKNEEESATFATCGENTLRHFFNLMLYDARTRSFNVDHLKNQNLNPVGQGLIDFFEKIQNCKDLANSGEKTIVDTWNHLLWDLNEKFKLQGKKKIRYLKLKEQSLENLECEIDGKFSTLLQTCEAIFGVSFEGNTDEKRLTTLIQFLYPEKDIQIDIKIINQGFQATITKHSGQSFSFHWKSQGPHGELGAIKSNIQPAPHNIQNIPDAIRILDPYLEIKMGSFYRMIPDPYKVDKKYLSMRQNDDYRKNLEKDQKDRQYHFVTELFEYIKNIHSCPSSFYPLMKNRLKALPVEGGLLYFYKEFTAEQALSPTLLSLAEMPNFTKDDFEKFHNIIIEMKPKSFNLDVLQCPFKAEHFLKLPELKVLIFDAIYPLNEFNRPEKWKEWIQQLYSAIKYMTVNLDEVDGMNENIARYTNINTLTLNFKKRDHLDLRDLILKNYFKGIHINGNLKKLSINNTVQELTLKQPILGPFELSSESNLENITLDKVALQEMNWKMSNTNLPIVQLNNSVCHTFNAQTYANARIFFDNSLVKNISLLPRQEKIHIGSDVDHTVSRVENQSQKSLDQYQSTEATCLQKMRGHDVIARQPFPFMSVQQKSDEELILIIKEECKDLTQYISDMSLKIKTDIRDHQKSKENAHKIRVLYSGRVFPIGKNIAPQDNLVYMKTFAAAYAADLDWFAWMDFFNIQTPHSQFLKQAFEALRDENETFDPALLKAMKETYEEMSSARKVKK